jgi:hypothetical protein
MMTLLSNRFSLQRGEQWRKVVAIWRTEYRKHGRRESKE